MPEKPTREPPKRLDLADGPTKYVDRPANEGKHGDGDEEPNPGFPRSPVDNTAPDPRSKPGQKNRQE
jgi:hypothetical protein